MTTETIIPNGSTRLHVVSSEPSEPVGDFTLVVLPGMGQAAEDFSDVMAEALVARSVYVSLRGRGRSDSPETGYSFADHVSDIAAVVDELALERVVVLAHSMSVPLALGYALEHPERVHGLILHDYPPMQPKLPQEWADGVIAQGAGSMSPHAVQRLVDEGDEVVLFGRLSEEACPVLLTGGGGDGAMLEPDLAELYTQLLPDCRVEIIPGAGHDPFEPSPDAFLAIVNEQLKRWA